MNTSAASQEARDAMREPTSEGRAQTTVDSVVSDALDKGREANRAMRDVSDNFIDAIDESIKTRPYTTLALVAAVGFLFGAAWRR